MGGANTGAVITAVGFAAASSTSIDVGNALLRFGRGYDGGAGAVRWRGALHTALL